jgi:hypothetical protein
MVDKYRKSISRRFVFASLFSVAIAAILLFAVPVSVVHPGVLLGAYSNGDSATGVGTPINVKGTWFMYNTYNGGTQTYNIVAGNPKNGENIIGSYMVTTNEAGQVIVIPTFNAGINVTAEHLAVSDKKFTSASPGKLDNADYGVPITPPSTGTIYIFAHFEVQY